MNGNVKTGIACCILSALVFGVTPIFASFSFDLGSNAMTLTFYRNAMAVPVLLVLLLVRKVDLRITKKELTSLAAVGVTFSATTTFLLYASYDYIGIGFATTLHFLYPVFTVLFVRIFFKEKMGTAKIIALIMATVGVILATGEGGAFAMTGIILALMSAVTYAGYITGIEKTAVSRMDSMKAIFYICIIISIALAIVDIPMGNILYCLPGKAMLHTSIVSISNSVIAYVMLVKGIKIIGAGNASIYSMLEPASGIVCGVLFLGEEVTVLKMISCILILTAVTIPILKDRKAIED